MSQPEVTSKTELLEEIERTWAGLNTVLDDLTEEQMTTQHDAEGWTVKDHLIHLAAWERSALYFLQSRPRHEALGVEESTYVQGTDDDINAVIHQQCKDTPLPKALARFHSTHQKLLAALEPLTGEDLNRPYRHYLPEERGEGGDRPAIDVIYGSTAHHYREHTTWIEKLVR